MKCLRKERASWHMRGNRVERERAAVGVIQGRMGVGERSGVTPVGNRVAMLRSRARDRGLIHSAVRHRPFHRHDDALHAVGNPCQGVAECR